MIEQRKIFRVFQLISRLRSPFGCTKNEVASDFDVSVRTIERYFLLLRELGFELIQNNEVFYINIPNQDVINPEEIVVFSPEEASIIKRAVLNCASAGPLQKSLLDKLYALSDLDEMAETLYRQNVARNIYLIRTAIKDKKQVVLKSYHSVNRSVDSDRLVEPIRFYYYYRYILAYEINSGTVKQFKTERIRNVEPTDNPFMYPEYHYRKRVDVFGISGTKPIIVRLQLTRRAASLLNEEMPDAILYVTTKNGKKYFEGPVYGLEGVGRFVLGLLDEIKVIEPPELIRYVSKRIKNYNPEVNN